ncbi:MAG TPA: hypothetical protein G4N94_12895 [Caldilineae bacterium]|nr:hypothetical protein [Caldilineae bacterium]
MPFHPPSARFRIAKCRHLGRLLARVLVLMALFALAWPASAYAGAPIPPGSTARPASDQSLPPAQYLPLVGGSSPYLGHSTCHTIPGASFASLPVLPPPSDRPAAAHADLNLALRGYEPVEAAKGLIWLDGPTDPLAPRLQGLFQPQRHPPITATYRVNDWDWDCNCRGETLTDPEVTLAALETAPYETLHVPESGYEIGNGYEVLVLYATSDSITLKYTRTDSVVSGYTLHLENICVEESLLALYKTLNAAGRSELPALVEGQAFARARADAIHVAIRDTGQFMDPRSYKDWW